MKFIIMEFYSTSLYLLSLRSKYISKHSVGKQAAASEMNSREYISEEDCINGKHYILQQTIFCCMLVVHFASTLNNFLGLFEMAFTMHFWDLRDVGMKVRFCLI
jgi:hypothetical protein